MYDGPCLEVRWFIRLTRFSGRGAGAMASCSIINGSQGERDRQSSSPVQ